MRKLLFLLLMFPFTCYGQEISITQSQKIDLKLPESIRQSTVTPKAKGMLIAGAALSAAGVGIALSGSAIKPGQDKALRVVGSGVVAIGTGFTIAGISKMK